MLFNFKQFKASHYADRLKPEELDDLEILIKIFPFKVSRYVLDELIDWDNRKIDPIFRLVFPQRAMLKDEHWELITAAQSWDKQRKAVQAIRRELNPHPDGQISNIPKIGNRQFGGIQHKYKETVLFFPAQGQSCHSFCTYCFRWAQFVNLGDEHKFKSKDHSDLFDYLSEHEEVTDILFSGGDPMFMTNEQLCSYLDILLTPELDHVTNIRIGTKALSFYPQRFLGAKHDPLFRKIDTLIKNGKHIALMAHFSHPRELKTEKVVQAISRLRNAGVEIRTQAPLIRGINNSASVWRKMWNKTVRLGMIPYYMFVERDTGAHHYFSVPLSEAYSIFTEAYSKVSGLAKTVRGPSMSANPGKILIDGIIEVNGEKKFVLKFLQARNPKLVNKTFLAKYNAEATWFDELELDTITFSYNDELSDTYEEELLPILKNS